jgi:ElaB/YqjD/DUF883 family membrane-anchored ribosome-binding protein
MTTEAAQNPQPPQPPVMDVAEVYRTLGRLEEAQSQTREILVRIEQRLDRQEERFDRQEDRNDQRFREVNRRIDRLWYTIVGIGAAIIVGYVLQQVFGG